MKQISLKTLMAVVAIAVSIPLSTPAAKAQVLTNNVKEMLGFCENRTSVIEFMQCLGRLEGLAATMWYSCLLDGPLLLRAGTADQTNSALIQAYIDYARKHPELWNKNWTLAAYPALSDTFPCTKDGQNIDPN